MEPEHWYIRHFAGHDKESAVDLQMAVPIVRPGDSDIASALRNVRQSTSGPNTKGFILAFIHNTGVGFNFLVCQPDFCAALYAYPYRGDFEPRYSCTFREGRDPMNSFVGEYLQESAMNLHIDYVHLVTHFAKRLSDWRFEPWENGTWGRSQDNYHVWRRNLWPLVKRIVATSPSCLDSMPSTVSDTLLKQLRGHAIEGMIVLNK